MQNAHVIMVGPSNNMCDWRGAPERQIETAGSMAQFLRSVFIGLVFSRPKGKDK